MRALRNVLVQKVWLCGLLTGVSFLALGGYDVIAVGIVAARRVSPARAWLAGAIANAISNTLGFHALTATAVRFRLLGRAGLSASEVTSVVALSWTALGFGFVSMISLAMTVSPDSRPEQRVIGVALIGALVLCTRLLGPGKRVSIKAFNLPLPSGRVALAQMLLGAIEMASAIGALYILMPEDFVSSFLSFSLVYIGAVLLGIASHAPGGLGVFEATMLSFGNGQGRAGILAALIIYRLIYNLCPFGLAALTFAGEEISASVSSRVGNS
jgi:phosphatidylglycerol lysyltransferase